MKSLYNFSQFSQNLLESSSPIVIDKLKDKYSISDLEWKAMRAIPEEGIEDDIEDYYKTTGAKDFVTKIVNLVSDGIFEDPGEVSEFMLNVAAVESCYGTNSKTYKRSNITKGIFQLDKKTSLNTVGYKGDPSTGNHKIKKYLMECKREIKNKLGLDWDKVPFESLSKPLYNALAARMFIGVRARSYSFDSETNITKERLVPIPKTKEKQASWWKKRYNSDQGAGTTSKFINPSCSI